MNYFLLDSGRVKADATEKWKTWRREQLECSCGNRRIKPQPIDADLEVPLPNLPLNFISGSSVGIIRDDLLEVLNATQFHRTFVVGQVVLNGCSVSGFHTFIGRNPIQIRGDSTSMFRTCQLCDNPVYVALREEHLLSGSIADRSPLYSTRRPVIILDSDTLASVIDSRIANVHRKLLGVRDEPLDGLPVNLRDAPHDFMMNILPQVFPKGPKRM